MTILPLPPESSTQVRFVAPSIGKLDPEIPTAHRRAASVADEVPELHDPEQLEGAGAVRHRRVLEVLAVEAAQRCGRGARRVEAGHARKGISEAIDTGIDGRIAEARPLHVSAYTFGTDRNASDTRSGLRTLTSRPSQPSGTVKVMAIGRSKAKSVVYVPAAIGPDHA